MGFAHSSTACVAAVLLALLALGQAGFLEEVQHFHTTYSNPTAASSPGRAWAPKTVASDYNEAFLRSRDWSSVTSACKALVKAEKRFAAKFLKTAFHDGLAVDLSPCVARGPGVNREACGLAQSSTYLPLVELTSPQTAFEPVDETFRRAVVKVASFYDVSVADTIAVCTAAAVEELSNNRVRIFGERDRDRAVANVRVGRLDKVLPATPAGMPARSASAAEWSAFWSRHGISVDQAVALQAAHGLMETQACFVGPEDNRFCNNTGRPEDCQNVRMHTWGNHYFKDVCAPTINVVSAPQEYPEEREHQMDEPAFTTFKSREQCKFSSPLFRSRAIIDPARRRAGDLPPRNDTADASFVSWVNDGCRAAAAWGVTNCPHSLKWWYTVADANLGRVCTSPTSSALRTALRRYVNQAAWDAAVPGALRLMLEKFTTFSTGRSAVFTSSWECSRPYAPLSCPAGTSRDACERCGDDSRRCQSCCQCPTAFRPAGFALTPGVTIPTGVVPPDPHLPHLAPTQPRNGEQQAAARRQMLQTTTPFNPNVPPPSPYDLPNDACSGRVVEVRGYPSSPFILRPFRANFTNPPVLRPTTLPDSPGQPGPVCGSEQCIEPYVIDILERTINIAGAPCTGTTILGYNGIAPGPTIITPVGRQTFVRFNNRIPTNSRLHPREPPCVGARQGRPISVHLHGSASLAPFDGFAEDTTCSGETKDYIYPSNRASTLWYHDHQLDITGDNAYAGLAGFYLVREVSQSNPSVVQERWGLSTIREEVLMLLADKVMTPQCQLRYEPEGVHLNSHYGDINLVSGTAFPVLNAGPTFVRFRFLNAAVSRPWLLSIVNAAGRDVSATNCFVVGSDGGYRRSPAPFPGRRGGLFIGVAERYDVVCDLSPFKGQTLYWWNTQDEDRMKDVPFFCFSHLVMQINVLNDCTAVRWGDNPNGYNCASVQFERNPAPIPTTLDRLLSPVEYNAALAAARAGRCDRTFVFGRGGGQWVINGETWQSARIAAKDVPLHSREIWCLEGKGGWFHPIHIHLIDMYVLYREDAGKYPILEQFESEVPKDVVQLHPGAKVAIVARWGPHLGEYMFHCHNLRHEDNAMMRTFVTVNNPQPRGGTVAVTPNVDPFLQLQQLTLAKRVGGTVFDEYDNPLMPPALAQVRPTGAVAPITAAFLRQSVLRAGIYRIFYPGPTVGEERGYLCDRTINPWLVFPCGTTPAP